MVKMTKWCSILIWSTLKKQSKIIFKQIGQKNTVLKMFFIEESESTTPWWLTWSSFFFVKNERQKNIFSQYILLTLICPSSGEVLNYRLYSSYDELMLRAD